MFRVVPGIKLVYGVVHSVQAPESRRSDARVALLTIRRLSAQPRNHRYVDRVALGEPPRAWWSRPSNGRLAMDVQAKRELWIMVAMAVACTIAFAVIETTW